MTALFDFTRWYYIFLRLYGAGDSHDRNDGIFKGTYENLSSPNSFIETAKLLLKDGIIGSIHSSILWFAIDVNRKYMSNFKRENGVSSIGYISITHHVAVKHRFYPCLRWTGECHSTPMMNGFCFQRNDKKCHGKGELGIPIWLTMRRDFL